MLPHSFHTTMTNVIATAMEPVDAVIVGGGPIGCLVGLQLAKFGCRPLVIEMEDKNAAPIYGRATTLWPRALETYEQLGLLDDLLSIGIVSQTGMNFRNGKAAPGGLVFGYNMNKHGDTACNFSLHLRQRLTERVFENKLRSHGHPVLHQHRLESWIDSDDAEFPITCFIRNQTQLYTVNCKYIVGADGGTSFVRKQAGIEFKGERSGAKWIRMDALVRTNMPSPRTLNSVMSDTHGLVLFCPIDDRKTRIGYVFSEELQKMYGDQEITKEIAMKEAKKALAPFTLEFDCVDWVTLYGIGQCIASTFVQDRIVLVGDACHTHSSGSAQGLNTGTADAVNLGWKLALMSKGLASNELLATYNAERKSSVQQVIDNDLIIATLISGKLPPKFAARTESPRDILTEWFENGKIQSFTLGLGISYDTVPSVLSRDLDVAPVATIKPGERGPDATVFRIGTNEAVRVHRALHNTGKFNIVVFTGRPHLNQERLRTLRTETNALVKRYPRSAELFTFSTLISGHGMGASELLGQEPWGTSWFDSCSAAHTAYGVDIDAGAVIVFRPDGYIGTVMALEAQGWLSSYFAGFLL